jgi:hypothetical protein
MVLGNIRSVGGFITLALLLSAASPAPEPTPSVQPAALVGTWRYSNDEQTVTYWFERNGAFTAESKTENSVRTFRGLWELKDNVITYTFTSDSGGGQVEGKQDADRLERIDESSLAIVAGDGTHRTYWRVK